MGVRLNLLILYVLYYLPVSPFLRFVLVLYSNFVIMTFAYLVEYIQYDIIVFTVCLYVICGIARG